MSGIRKLSSVFGRDYFEYLSGIGIIVLVSFCCGTVNVYGEPIDAEQKLDAIKNALVDHAFASNVSLASNAFVDSNGALYESSVITSDVNIEDMRVLSYLHESGVPKADLSFKSTLNDSCRDTSRGIKKQALITILKDSNANPYNRVGDHYIFEIGDIAEMNLIDHLERSQQWIVGKEAKYANSYEKYVSSKVSDNVEYRFEIIFKFRDAANLKRIGRNLIKQSLTIPYNFIVWGNPHLSGLEFNTRSAEHALEYRISLRELASNKVIWSSKSYLKYPGLNSDYGKEIIPASLRRELKTVTEHYVADVTNSVSCQPNYYKLGVVSGENDKFKIYAGNAVGIELGDQFLLSTSDGILDESIKLAEVNSLGLAEVEMINEKTAILKYLAGRKPVGLGEISRSTAVLF